MVSDIDVTGRPRDQARAEIVAALGGAEAGETVTVTADHDPEPALYQTQILHERILSWTAVDTDGDVAAVDVRVTKGKPSELVAFDVRSLVPQQRHAVLTETFVKLDPGQGFVLVNDHDPKPLYHELRSAHGDVVEWEYRSRDPDAWEVAVVKTDASTDVGGPAAASFDLRDIPEQERHATVLHRFGNLSNGDVLEVLADHEPHSLHNAFGQRYGEDVQWEVTQRDEDRCRVRITKGASEASATPELTVVEELDVREYPPAKRHELIFDSYADLAAGEGFVLVNDHDPKPLYHQFEAEAGPEFYWEYRARDPGEFRVLVGKATAQQSAESTA